CDFGPELATAVTEGRRNEFAGFTRFRSAETRAQIPDPNAESTFAKSTLDWSSICESSHAAQLLFTRELLATRRDRILPLIRGLKDGCGTFKIGESSELRVQWTLDRNSLLTLLANLQPHPLLP